MARVLVACLGNGLAGDSAAGSAVHSLLQGCTLPEGARLVLVPPGPMRLLEVLRDAEALVAVGEVELGARPGTIQVLDWKEVPVGADGQGRSGHALRVAMEAARIRDPARAPRTAFLVGIEGRAYGGHEGQLHAEVAGALAGAARVVLDLAHGLAGLDLPTLEEEASAMTLAVAEVLDAAELSVATPATPRPPGPRA
jgi:hydrogenase maturation protease